MNFVLYGEQCWNMLVFSGDRFGTFEHICLNVHYIVSILYEKQKEWVNLLMLVRQIFEKFVLIRKIFMIHQEDN